MHLSVPCPIDVSDMAIIERNFGEVYAARYGATTKAPIEIVSYRIAVWQESEKPVLALPERSGRSMDAAKTATTAVIFGGKSYDIPVYQRELLPPELDIDGPALVEEDGASTVVPPGWRTTLDQIGCLVLRKA